MKRILLSVLLLVFIVNLVGWQWLFVQMQNRQHEMEWGSIATGEGAADMVAIRIEKSATGKAFRVNDHEIIYEGKLYDVKRSQNTEGGTVYYSKEDHAEEDLIVSFNVVIKNNVCEGASVHSKNTKPVKLVLSDYILSFSKRIITLPPITAIHNSHFRVPNTPFLDSVLMPPELI